jgi:hypothetical protein
MLETLRALRAAVIARDTRRGSSTQADAEAILRKAEKKRCLREKRATAHTTASPTVIANPPATATIVSNPPTTADCSSNQIGTNIATATPSTSSDGYNTAHPEQLYSLLTAAAPTMLDVTPDPCKTDPNPADYSLNDIEQTICKIRKCHEKMGALVPESVQETAEALTRAIQARDAAVSTQTATDPIADFNSDTTVPTPTPTSAPVPTPALSSPAKTSTPNSNPIRSDTAMTAPSPAPTHYETTTTKPPDREIEAAVTTAPGPVKSQVELTTTIAAAAATAVTTATNTTVKQHDPNPQDSEELEKERRENGEEREDEMQQTREENKGSTEREERRDDKGIEEKV